MCRSAHPSHQLPHRRAAAAPRKPKDPSLRAADADRERTIEALRLHAGEGRLTIDELGGRVGAATQARTLGDLHALLVDLPRLRLPSDERAIRARATAELRQHLTGYIVVNALLVAIWAITGAGYAWFVWSVLGWGIALVMHAAPLLTAPGPRGNRTVLRA